MNRRGQASPEQKPSGDHVVNTGLPLTGQQRVVLTVRTVEAVCQHPLGRRVVLMVELVPTTPLTGPRCVELTDDTPRHVTQVKPPRVQIPGPVVAEFLDQELDSVLNPFV